jgi:hypothetical protein
MPDAASAARGVYKPRRPQASPLFRLVSDHLHRLQTVYDERFAREYGPWRPVVAQVADKFLACGVLDHGFARIRCDACTHEYLLAFSCKCRYFCPSCHAKRLAIWAQWLDTTLLAPVPHRQVVLTIPKRLRTYCLYRRRLLGEIARVAARTVTAAIRSLTGERDLAVGIVACLQTPPARPPTPRPPREDGPRRRPATRRGRSACAAVPPQRPRGPRRPPPAPGHPPGPQADPPSRHTGAVAVAPKPAHQRSRGRGPGPILPPSIEFPIALWG